MSEKMSDERQEAVSESRLAEMREKVETGRRLGTVWSGFYAWDVSRLLDEGEHLRAKLAAAQAREATALDFARYVANEYDEDGELTTMATHARELLASVQADAGAADSGGKG